MILSRSWRSCRTWPTNALLESWLQVAGKEWKVERKLVIIQGFHYMHLVRSCHMNHHELNKSKFLNNTNFPSQSFCVWAMPARSTGAALHLIDVACIRPPIQQRTSQLHGSMTVGLIFRGTSVNLSGSSEKPFNWCCSCKIDLPNKNNGVYQYISLVLPPPFSFDRTFGFSLGSKSINTAKHSWAHQTGSIWGLGESISFDSEVSPVMHVD